MKVLITGANGQLGRALQRSVPADAVVIACGHADMDIGDAAQVAARVAEHQPDLIINAAAYTAVDKAESEVAAAQRGNAEGPAHLADAARALPHTRLLHVSTDFVFDGSSSRPYTVDAATAPLGVYGATKLAGERVVLNALPGRSLVMRTAWVYAAQGNNFMRTMLRLMKERGTVRVVADQIGTPTSADSLAQAIWRCATRPHVHGIHHWSDAGVASWYDFAVAIAEEAAARGLLPAGVQVLPIATEDFPTPAKRPAYSVLDKRATLAALDLPAVHWREMLRRVLDEVRD